MIKIRILMHIPHWNAYCPQLPLNDVINPAKMMMQLAKYRSVSDVWQQFNNAYPFLRLDFYKYVHQKPGMMVKQKINHSTNLANAGILREGEVDISETTTVRQLEQKFITEFGLSVEVSRKSGKIWLQTTISENWTLKQQNEHGRELSDTVENSTPPG